MRSKSLFILSLCLLSLVCAAAPAASPSDIRSNTRLTTGWIFQQGDYPGAENPEFNTLGWSSVTLPHCWGWEQAQKGQAFYRGPGWYRCGLTVTPQPGKRYFLRFDAASSVADVYLNGQLLGEHRGGFGAFCFEITHDLRSAGTNCLAVRVSNSPQEDIAPVSADFPFYGGLYRPVHLIETSGQCFALTDHASPGVSWLQSSVSATQAVLKVTAQISNDATNRRTLRFTTRVLTPEGQEVAGTNQLVALPPGSTSPFWVTLVMPNPHLWNGRLDPFLYRAVVGLSATNELVDAVEQPLGLRYYRVDPERGFFLNGQPYPIYGVCRHQDRPDKGWAVSEADLTEDVGLIKEIGATAVRCAHYEHNDYFYSLCDQAGILIWAEIPQVDGINASSAFEETSTSQLRDLIRQNVNHPSIFAWSLFNEIGNGKTADPQRELQDLNGIAHAEDPTRPTIAATSNDKFPQMNRIPDLLGRNSYPGWYWGKPTAEVIGAWMDREHYTSQSGGFCVSEYGAGANPNQHEDHPRQPVPTSQWHPEEWQNTVHEAAWSAIKSHPFIWGSFAWNMFDFTSYWRHEGATLGLNDKGLVTADRKTKKDVFYFYQANWSKEPVLYITDRRFTDRTNAVTDVKIYSNEAKVELFLNGASQGERDNDGNAVFVWPGMKLAPGENHVEARAELKGQPSTDSCVWRLTP